MSAKHPPGPRKVHPRVSDERCRAVPPSNALAYALALDLFDARAEAKTRCACVWAETHDGGEQVEECAPHAAMREAWEAHAEMDRSLSIAWGKKVLEADAEVARLRGALEDVRDIARDLETAEAIARAALAPQKEEKHAD